MRRGTGRGEPGDLVCVLTRHGDEAPAGFWLAPGDRLRQERLALRLTEALRGERREARTDRAGSDQIASPGRRRRFARGDCEGGVGRPPARRRRMRQRLRGFKGGGVEVEARSSGFIGEGDREGVGRGRDFACAWEVERGRRTYRRAAFQSNGPDDGTAKPPRERS